MIGPQIFQLAIVVVVVGVAVMVGSALTFIVLGVREQRAGRRQPRP